MFHILPELFIIAGIEASIITSLGIWKFVIFFSEFTIAMSGPFSISNCISLTNFFFVVLSNWFIFSNKLDKPLLKFTLIFSSVVLFFSIKFLKKTFKTWPKIIGSLTFIIDALRWSDKSILFSLQSLISFSIKSCNSEILIKLQSMIAFLWIVMFSLRMLFFSLLL